MTSSTDARFRCHNEARMSADEHPDVVRFAVWMTGSREAGVAALREVQPSAQALCLRVAEVVRWFMARARRRLPVDLDAILRQETAILDLDHPEIRGDVRRLYVLQRELQRACLTTTLLNLPAGPRAAFVLQELLGWPAEQVDAVFDTPVAARTNYLRAVRALTNYLGVRCEHVEPGNSCRCERRLPAALENGFLSWPDREDLAADAPLEGTRPRTIETLFADVPAPV
ncbi:hypothetical protein [Nannocystis pusilla]|uniref:hypothetical protein n=1 Tax=Nannocystis pusilla TaxID=889268 RepID=UPI003DA2910C